MKWIGITIPMIVMALGLVACNQPEMSIDNPASRAATSIPLANTKTTPSTVFYDYNYSVHHVYRDSNKEISDIWFDLTFNTWHYQNLNDRKTQAPKASTDPFSIVYSQQFHTVYVDENREISDIYYESPSETWTYQNLSGKNPGTPKARAKSRVFAMMFADHPHHLFIDVNNQVSDLYYDPPTGRWIYQNLSNLAGSKTVNASATQVASARTAEGHFVLYLDSDGKVSVLSYRGDHWSNEDGLPWFDPGTRVVLGNPFAVSDPMPEGGFLVGPGPGNPTSIVDIETRDFYSGPVGSDLSGVDYQGQMHYLYIGTNGHLFDQTVGTGSPIDRVTSVADAGGAAASAPVPGLFSAKPSAVVYRNQAHYLYVDVNRKLSDIWYDPVGSRWRYQVLNDLP